MSSPPGNRPIATRSVRLQIGERSALTTTTLTFSEATPEIELATAFGSVEVTTRGVGRFIVENSVVRLLDLEPAAKVAVSGRVDYRATPHGLSRWTDPSDGHHYVIGSGALGGAAHFLACSEGPADRMVTTLTVEANGIVRAAQAPRPHDAREPTVASHHVGLVAGPWRCHSGDGVELLSRRALDRPAALDVLAVDARRALDWLLGWFGTTRHDAPWGTTYTQVLLPEAPWLAMEHPGCVLLSERLLDASSGQRVAVLAHEAAHQWLGNLVSPLVWSDVGAFEGLAELLGQLACEAIVGKDATHDLARRRSKGPLALPPIRTDLRGIVTTAGLAEVAGPVQHADLFRAVRAEIGAETFQTRVRALVRRHAGSACSTSDLWAGLRVAPRQPHALRLPAVKLSDPAAWWADLNKLAACDPTTAATAARRAFRDCAPGPRRVREALAAMTDPTTPYPVIAGLVAELSRSDRSQFDVWSNHLPGDVVPISLRANHQSTRFDATPGQIPWEYP